MYKGKELAVRKKIYNYGSDESLKAPTIIGGNPTGVISYNQTPHKFAQLIYRAMQDGTWFAQQVNISKDKVNYPLLPENIKRSYDLVLAQLIMNDSIQTNQLVDSINQYITSPVVNAALALQAYQESQHSDSYSIMAEDICQDTDRIYELHKHDEELFLKNKAVADMYNILYQGTTPTNEDLLLAFAANQILEELVFPGGFVFFHSIENYMPSTDEMICEIQKDERLHVRLFQGIFRTAIKESFDGVVPAIVIERIHNMVKIMVDAEIRWTKYVTKDMLGFSDHSIKVYIESQGNSVCNNLGLPLLYEEVPLEKNPLKQKLLSHYKNAEEVTTKSLFFEANVADYQKTGPDMSADLGSVNWDD